MDFAKFFKNHLRKRKKKKHYTFTKSFCSKEFHTRKQGLPQPMRLSELWI